MSTSRAPRRRLILLSAVWPVAGTLSGCGFALRRGYKQLVAFEAERATAARTGLARFDRLLAEADYVQAAQQFTPDARLELGPGGSAQGTAAIRARLTAGAAGQGGFHVDKDEVIAGEVQQRGHVGPAAGAGRGFEATWVLGPDGRWQMSRLQLGAAVP